MKRAVLVAGDFVRTGGMDMPNFALARRLAERGTSVDAVAFRADPELIALPNIKLTRVPKPLGSYRLGLPILDLMGQRVARSLRPGDGRTVVNGGNCRVGDVNWVHYVHAAYQPGTPALGLVQALKSTAGHHTNLKRERDALRLAKLVIVNSERTRRDLVERLELEDSRIRTVYYGIDATAFSPASEPQRTAAREALGFQQRPHIAFVGALGDRRKGFDTLFAAWSSLCRSSDWDCNLVVIGRGAELEQWRARAQAASLADRILFLGFRRDVPQILAACDALVAPTRYEAFGLGVQEALCMGLPALVSASAGVAELYPQDLQELLLQDPDSAAELHRRLLGWRASQPDLEARTLHLARALRARTWQTMADDIIELLQQ